MRRYLMVLTASLALAAAGCGDDDDKAGDASTNPAPEPAPVTQAEEPPEAARDQYGCVEAAQPDPKQDGGQKKPTEELAGDYTVTFRTNCGSFTIEIDEQVGGLSAASFVQLARKGFYDDTFFHRISPGFVIQGGDPLGQGIGGPGYKTKDPPPEGATYPKGTVAMAKGANEPPGTSGSQFFVMTGDGGLPPEYAIVGKVTKGMKVVDAIGKQGDASEQPTAVIKIEKATVSGG